MTKQATVDLRTTADGAMDVQPQDDRTMDPQRVEPLADGGIGGKPPMRPPEFHQTVFWQPNRVALATGWKLPPMLTALRRGALCRCPACGRTDLFRGYLRVAESCAACGAPLGSARADDAPPYFTIFIVGHIVVLLMVMAERRWDYSMWTAAAIWLPVTLALSLLLLRPIKGATVGLTLKLGLMKSASGE